jgi:hypothetical protein
METPKVDAATSTPATIPDKDHVVDIADKTAPTFFDRTMSKIADFLFPTFLRQEYSRIIAFLAKAKYVCLALGVTIFFALAEWEQPGHFPRPIELTCALVRMIHRFSFPRIKSLHYYGIVAYQY